MFEVGDRVVIVGPPYEDSPSSNAVGFFKEMMGKSIGFETTIQEIGSQVHVDDGLDSLMWIYRLDGVDWWWAEDWLMPASDEVLDSMASESDILSLLQG